MHALLSRAPFLSLKSEAQPSCPPLPEPLLASSQGGASANRLSAETGIVPVWAGWEFLTLVSARLLGTAEGPLSPSVGDLSVFSPRFPPPLASWLLPRWGLALAPGLTNTPFSLATPGAGLIQSPGNRGFWRKRVVQIATGYH